MSAHNKSITILVVDDEKLIRNLLGDTLAALGYTTITAEDYTEANGILENRHIDIVITDIMLPDKTGIELIARVKEKMPKTPVLAISGKNVPKQIVMDAGGWLSGQAFPDRSCRGLDSKNSAKVRYQWLNRLLP